MLNAARLTTALLVAAPAVIAQDPPPPLNWAKMDGFTYDGGWYPKPVDFYAVIDPTSGHSAEDYLGIDSGPDVWWHASAVALAGQSVAAEGLAYGRLRGKTPDDIPSGTSYDPEWDAGEPSPGDTAVAVLPTGKLTGLPEQNDSEPFVAAWGWVHDENYNGVPDNFEIAYHLAPDVDNYDGAADHYWSCAWVTPYAPCENGRPVWRSDFCNGEEHTPNTNPFLLATNLPKDTGHFGYWLMSYGNDTTTWIGGDKTCLHLPSVVRCVSTVQTFEHGWAWMQTSAPEVPAVPEWGMNLTFQFWFRESPANGGSGFSDVVTFNSSWD